MCFSSLLSHLSPSLLSHLLLRLPLSLPSQAQLSASELGKGECSEDIGSPLSLALGTGMGEAGLGFTPSCPLLQEGCRTKGLGLGSVWTVMPQDLVSLETLRLGPTLLSPCSEPEVAWGPPTLAGLSTKALSIFHTLSI